jgi:hypothetical protein
MTSKLPQTLKADIVTSTHMYLIKHVSFLRLTHQIKMLLCHAYIQKKTLTLIIPTHCRLSNELTDFLNLHSSTFKTQEQL